jgi:hypothetical protein
MRKEKECEVGCVEDGMKYRQKKGAIMTLVTISIYRNK